MGLWVIQMCWVLVGKVEYVSSPWDCDSAPFEGFSLTWSLKVFFAWIAGILKFVFRFDGVIFSRFCCFEGLLPGLLGL